MATQLPDPQDPRSFNAPARSYNSVIRTGDKNQPDPFKTGQGMAPNMGNDALPHVVTFQGLFRTASQVYRISDEALKDSFANARHMRASVSIEECLEQRQRSVCLLNWHVEPEDESSPIAKALATEVNAIVKQLPQFLKYREWLMLAIWYGRNAAQHRYRWKSISGKERVVVDRWLPVHGDKLCYKYEDPWDAGVNSDQVGIRVGAGYTGGKVAGRWKVEATGKIGATDYGLAYFLEPWERPLLCIHTHQIEDAPFEAPEYAGWIHGVGLRHRLYWEWMQSQECLAFLMEYLERSAFGLEMWYYPAGNPEAMEKTKAAAEQRIGNNRTAILVPFYPDAGMAGSPGVQRIEPSMAGVEVLHRLLTEFFGHRIKRLILGQTLTTESGSTGLGSNLASVHLDTYLQIVRYDAANLSETLTHELLKPLIGYNFPQYADVPLKFVIETEAPDVDSKLGGIERAWGMGLRVKASDIYEMLSIAPPEATDEVLQNKQPGGGGEGGAPGMGATAPGFGPGKPDEKQPEDDGSKDEARNVTKLQKDDQEGETQSTGEGEKGGRSFDGGEKYAKPHDVSGEPRDAKGEWTAGGNHSATSDKPKAATHRIVAKHNGDVLWEGHEDEGKRMMEEAAAMGESGAELQAIPQGGRGFQEWFSGSKIVGKDGKPAVVYHGTAGEDFNRFEDKGPGRERWGNRGHYFTPDAEYADVYASALGEREGARLVPVYLAIKNPKIVQIKESSFLTDEQIARYESEGYDGLVTMPTSRAGDDFDISKAEEIVAFRPEQIKSAVGNKGTFDATNPDIRYARTGDVEAYRADPSYKAEPKDKPEGESEIEKYCRTQENALLAELRWLESRTALYEARRVAA